MATAVTMKDYRVNAYPSTWCPGCGDFGVVAATQRALANLGAWRGVRTANLNTAAPS